MPRGCGRDTRRTVEELEGLLGEAAGTATRRAIAVFVRESRAADDGRATLEEGTLNDPDILEVDDS